MDELTVSALNSEPVSSGFRYAVVEGGPCRLWVPVNMAGDPHGVYASLPAALAAVTGCEPDRRERRAVAALSDAVVDAAKQAARKALGPHV